MLYFPLFIILILNLYLICNGFIPTQSRIIRNKLNMQNDFGNSGSPCQIKVVGVGGGGGNAVNRIVESQQTVGGVEMWAINTDMQALGRNRAPMKLSIGQTTSRGLGAGGNPSVGALAADESRDEIKEMVSGADMVFVTAGMGGGTGSGAAPIVAECAKESGALTVGIVTKPFGFEGRKRMQQAREAILEMRDKVDTLIVVSNDKLLQIVPENTPLEDAFLVADDVLRQGVVGISDIIIKPGIINVDFADVRTIMGNAGTALMGIGNGKGKNRAVDAANAAISSPLLDFPITKAKGIVFNVVGSEDMSLQEINAAAEVIYDNVDSDANIIFGALVDNNMPEGEVAITVLATGFSTDFFDQKIENERNLRQLQRGESKDMTVGNAKKLSMLGDTLSTMPTSPKTNYYSPSKTVSNVYDRMEKSSSDSFFDDDDDDDMEVDSSNSRRGRNKGKVTKKKRLGGIFGFLKRLLFG